MTSHLYAHGIGEGHATNRPPLFRGEEYNYWKTRMTLHIKSVDYELWKIVTEGNSIPMVVKDGVSVEKPLKDYISIDYDKLQDNAKALNLLYCGLDAEQFNKVSGCDTAQEVWLKLQNIYEGTNQVKETKISMLTHEYELFCMKDDETISTMFSRFTNILNGLKSLGKVYSCAENIRKLLRSLPEAWDAKVTAIQEAKDLTKMDLDELLGSLLTHEIIMKSRTDKESKGKKTLAFKGVSNEDDDSDDDEDIAMMARKFKRFMRKWKPSNQGENSRDSNAKEREIICYECNEPGHIKTNCPRLKKERNERSYAKKKAFKVSTWDDSSDSSDNEDEENAKICLIDEEIERNDSQEKDGLPYLELIRNFDLLLKKYDKLKLKIKSSKEANRFDSSFNDNLILSDNSSIKSQSSLSSKEVLINEDSKIEELEAEKVNLCTKVNDLESTLSKFTSSTQKLNLLIGSQRCVFNKAGLGYEPKEKMYKNFFTKCDEIKDCKECGRLFVGSHKCPLKRQTLLNGKLVRYVWVRKRISP